MKQFPKMAISVAVLLCLALLAACQRAVKVLPASGESGMVVSASPESSLPQTEPNAPASSNLLLAGSETEPAAPPNGGSGPADGPEPAQPEETVPAPGDNSAACPETSEPAPEPSVPPADKPVSDPEPEPEPVKNSTLYVLMYHSFAPEGTSCNDWTLTDTRFREDLQWLSDNGYTTVLPSELAAGQPLPERAVMLTFDDGYDNNYSIAYPLLQEFQAKAVISLIVNHQDNQDPGFLSWDMCKEMVQSGLVEIGSHTYDHHNSSPQGIKRAKDESREAYQARVLTDIQTSIDLIEENLGITVQFFAYPFGKTEAWADGYLEEHFAVTVTTDYGKTDISKGLYNMKRCNISLREPPSFTLPAG